MIPESKVYCNNKKKHHDAKQLREERVCVSFHVPIPAFHEVRAETGQDHGGMLLTGFPIHNILSLLSQMTLDCLPRNSVTCSGLDAPTSIIRQAKALQTCLDTKNFLNEYSFFPDDTKLCKVDINRASTSDTQSTTSCEKSHNNRHSCLSQWSQFIDNVIDFSYPEAKHC